MTAGSTVAAAAAMDAAALAAAAAMDAAALAAAAVVAPAVTLSAANSGLADCEQCLAAAVAQSLRQQQQAAVNVAPAPSAVDADVILDFANPDVHHHLRAQPAYVASEHHLTVHLHLRLRYVVPAAVTELHAGCHHQSGC